MAPKRQRKANVVVENIDKYKNIVISDVLCPICRSILIEPVTLPCNHDFCLACFNGSTENTTLTCPLCRIRIGSWLRTAKKENKIINVTLWQTLQHKFPQEIKKRQEGEDLETNEQVSIRLAHPGEIRREYEIQLAKEQSEIKRERDAEREASEITIQQILDEEQKAAIDETEKLHHDEELARRLANDLSNPGPSNLSAVPKKCPKNMSIDKYFMTIAKRTAEESAAKNACNNSQKPYVSQAQTVQKLANKSHTSTILCQNRDSKNSCSAAYKHLLLTKTLQREQNNSNGSDSGDSIKQEMRYFKPIRTVPKSVPKLLGDGNLSVVQLLKVPAILAKKISPVYIRKPNSLGLKTIPNENSAFVSLEVKQSSKKAGITKKQGAQYSVSESGKLIKQYYNKKRTAQSRIETSTSNTSPHISPNDFRGFKNESNQNNIQRMSALVKSLSTNVNGENSCVKQVTNNNNTGEIKPINDSKNPSQVPQVKSSMCDQERRDYEYALKLQEKLNNPRHREYTTRSQYKLSKPARTNKRKRQVTLDELVTPKKFKI